jgi:hypothetical protein
LGGSKSAVIVFYFRVPSNCLLALTRTCGRGTVNSQVAALAEELKPVSWLEVCRRGMVHCN